MDRLAEISARASAATPGPWKWSPNYNLTGSDDMILIPTDGGMYLPEDRDAAFIAHARTDIPWLLAEVEHLRQVIELEAQLLDAAAEHSGEPGAIPITFVSLTRGLAATLRAALADPPKEGV